MTTNLVGGVRSVPVSGESSPRPQTLLFAFFGAHVLGRPMMVASMSILEVLERVGVSSHAARSALNRMVKKGLLIRERQGRQVYLGLTSRSEEILNEGMARIWRRGAVNDQWDGRWTILSFSFPDSWHEQRKELRARLNWAGFGGLRGGMWIAPAIVDVDRLLDGIQVANHVASFTAHATASTDVAEMVADAWQLPRIARGYEEFLERWSAADDLAATDPLGLQLVLQAEWLRAIRGDPLLPVELLPAPWPAQAAQQLFRSLDADVSAAARASAATLATIPRRDPQ